MFFLTLVVLSVIVKKASTAVSLAIITIRVFLQTPACQELADCEAMLAFASDKCAGNVRVDLVNDPSSSSASRRSDDHQMRARIEGRHEEAGESSTSQSSSTLETVQNNNAFGDCLQSKLGDAVKIPNPGKVLLLLLCQCAAIIL